MEIYQAWAAEETTWVVFCFALATGLGAMCLDPGKLEQVDLHNQRCTLQQDTTSTFLLAAVCSTPFCEVGFQMPRTTRTVFRDVSGFFWMQPLLWEIGAEVTLLWVLRAGRHTKDEAYRFVSSMAHSTQRRDAKK